MASTAPLCVQEFTQGWKWRPNAEIACVAWHGLPESLAWRRRAAALESGLRARGGQLSAASALRADAHVGYVRSDGRRRAAADGRRRWGIRPGRDACARGATAAGDATAAAPAAATLGCCRAGGRAANEWYVPAAAAAAAIGAAGYGYGHVTVRQEPGAAARFAAPGRVWFGTHRIGHRRWRGQRSLYEPSDGCCAYGVESGWRSADGGGRGAAANCRWWC